MGIAGCGQTVPEEEEEEEELVVDGGANEVEFNKAGFGNYNGREGHTQVTSRAERQRGPG